MGVIHIVGHRYLYIYIYIMYVMIFIKLTILPIFRISVFVLKTPRVGVTLFADSFTRLSINLVYYLFMYIR